MRAQTPTPMPKETMMRFYQQQHRFYCGVDLHARSMYLCVLDPAGQTLLHRDFPADARAFLDAVAPYRDGLVVAVECMFAWYWLADLCHEHQIPFVLGHALYMKAIHQGKSKNDRLDAAKIAGLLRGGLLPQAYVYPKAMRATRDLLRRRSFLVRRRADLLAHLVNTNSQYNLPALNKKLVYPANRGELNLAERFTDPSAKKLVGGRRTVNDPPPRGRRGWRTAACDGRVRCRGRSARA